MPALLRVILISLIGGRNNCFLQLGVQFGLKISSSFGTADLTGIHKRRLRIHKSLIPIKVPVTVLYFMVGFDKMAEDEKLAGSSNTVDTARADRSVWLMKCPPVVAQAWKQCTEAGQPLAKVILSVDPLQTQESNALQVTMELAANDFSTIPKSYSLNMSKDIVPMCIFSETSQGKMAIDGKVEHKFDMKPNNQNIDDYRKLCRERTNKSMVKNRQVQVLENDRGGYASMQGIDYSAINSRDKKKTVAPLKGQEMKRTRRDRGEMEDIMFKLFERQPNWTLKQLMQETDQPAQYLKDLLSELCIYNKKGTNQGTYELKPEYKKTAEDMEAE